MGILYRRPLALSNIVDVKLGPDVGETRRHESGWPMGHMSQGDKERHEHPSWAVDPSRMLAWPRRQTKFALHFVGGIRNRTCRSPP